MPHEGAILFATSLAPSRFSTLSHEQHDYWKKVTEHNMCFSLFSTNFFETLLIQRGNQHDIVINVKKS